MQNRTLPHNIKLTFHMRNLYNFVIWISKEKKDSPITQEKDMPPQIYQTEHSIAYTFNVAPAPQNWVMHI